MTSRLPWGILAALLALHLLGAATFERGGWPVVAGDEATYRMQAESLAWDLDLLYSRRDFDRFVDLHGTEPEGLILQSGDDGAHIVYGKPFFYAAFLAPFVRVLPVGGPFLANALLLAVAALVSARVLERRLGALAPLAVAVAVFGSVSFAYTWWVHADLFLMCLVALAFALAAAGRDDERRVRTVSSPLAPPKGTLLRWLGAGALLAMVGFSRPMYFTLFCPAFFMAVAEAAPPVRRRAGLSPRGDRGGNTLALAGAALVLLLVAGGVHQSLTGSWTSYGASRLGFYSYTGFPGVDSDWGESLRQFGDHAVPATDQLVRDRQWVLSLWGWNTVYYLIGAQVGILPYFLPLAVFMRRRPRGATDWAILAAVALAAAAFLYLRPFNFYGGGGAVANRYFLPMYPALWFYGRKPLRAPWLLAVAAGTALFVSPLWLAPRHFPLWQAEQDAGYHYVGPLAECCLPYETTQGHLKVSWREDVIHRGLWIRFLDRGLVGLNDGEVLRLAPQGGTLLVGTYKPLEALEIRLRAPAGTALLADGEALERPAAGEPWRLETTGTRAVHSMWWTWEPFYLYRWHLRPSGRERPVRLELSPVPADVVVPPTP